MSLSSIASQFEATTKEYHDKELVNTGLQKNYFLTKLLNKAKQTATGRMYTWRVKFDKSDTQWLAEFEEQNTATPEKITEAKVGYVFSSTPCMISAQELKKNHGNERKLNLLTESLEMLQDDVTDNLATVLISGTAALKQPIGLETWVQEVPGTTTPTSVAEIDRSDRTWWRNQATDLSGTLGLGMPSLESLKLACAHGSEKVDAILTSKTAYAWMYANAVGLQREEHKDAAKLGFVSFTWDGMPVTYSDEIESGKSGGDSIYLLRLKDWELNFMADEGRMHRTEWFKPEKTRAICCYMYNDLTLLCKKPYNQGVLFDVTGA